MKYTHQNQYDVRTTLFLREKQVQEQQLTPESDVTARNSIDYFQTMHLTSFSILLIKRPLENVRVVI